MVPHADHAINALLTEARTFRSAATATTHPAYRAKLLKTARDLEAEASEIEVGEAGGTTNI